MAKTLPEAIAPLPADERAKVEARMTVLLKARQACHPGDPPEHIKEAVADARMDGRHDRLNKLLDDE